MAPLINDPVDLLLGTDNDAVIVNGEFQFARGIAGVAQLIRIAIQMVAGEWFLNLDAGIRYLENDHVTAQQAILAQKPSVVKARKEFRAAILGVPGVNEIKYLDVTFTSKTRTLNVSWQVTTTFGDTVADSLSKSA